jgi:hypothetical protein
MSSSSSSSNSNRRTTLQRMGKAVPKTVKKSLGFGKYSRAREAAAAAAEVAAEEERRAADAIAAREVADERAQELAEHLLKHRLLDAEAAKRLYLQEEIDAANGARAAADVYAKSLAEEPSDDCWLCLECNAAGGGKRRRKGGGGGGAYMNGPSCYHYELYDPANGENFDSRDADEPPVNPWVSYFQPKPIDENDLKLGLAAFEVLVGDKTRSEWVRAVSHENVVEEKDNGDGTVRRLLVARKYRFEHSFTVVVAAADFAAKTRLVKIPPWAQLNGASLYPPAQEEDQKKEMEDGDVEEEEAEEEAASEVERDSAFSSSSEEGDFVGGFWNSSAELFQGLWGSRGRGTSE